MAVAPTASTIRVLLSVASVMELTRLVCFSPVSIYTSAYTILGSIQRGTKRARTDPSPPESRTRTRTRAGGLRYDVARAQNEDSTRHSATVAADTTAKQLFRVLFSSLSTADLEVVVKDGNRELDRRHGVI